MYSSDVEYLWTLNMIKKNLKIIFEWNTQEIALRQSADNSELAVIEAKLSWIVHIIAAILKIKQSTGCR
jgi:hypothetical protein